MGLIDSRLRCGLRTVKTSFKRNRIPVPWGRIKVEGYFTGISTCERVGGTYHIEWCVTSGVPTLVHELGHMFVEHRRLRRRSLFRRYFSQVNDDHIGRLVILRGMDLLGIPPSLFGGGYVSNYARMDGEEDFCECLARLWECDFELDDVGARGRCREKLEAVCELMGIPV